MAETGWVNMSHSRSEGTAWQMNLSYSTSFSGGSSSITINSFQVRRQVTKTYDSSSDGDVKCWVTSDSWSTYNSPTWPNFKVSRTAWTATNWQGLGGHSRTGLTPSKAYTFVVHWDDVTADSSLNWDATCSFSITTAGYATYWNDINAYNPEATAKGALKFDVVVKNRSGTQVDKWTDCTNEPWGSSSYQWGYTATISNITSNLTGAHYTTNSVTGKGDSSFSWTFNTASYNANLYTAWNTYTVKYDGNGATSGSTASSSHTYNTVKTLTANGFSRDGFTFKGWSTSSTATSATYTDKQSVSNLTSTDGGTVTLYAVWAHKPIKVNINGTWKDGYPYVNVNGTWKQAKCVWVNVGGTWKPMK